jgi:hypothetical protein
VRRLARIAVCLLLAAGCNNVLGIEDLPHAGTPCAVCALQCPSERSACDNDVHCAALDACQRACPLSAPLCRKACEDAHPDWATNTAFLAYDRCLRTSCVDVCYGTAGLIAAIDARCASADVACKDYETQCLQSNDAGSPAGTCERVMACLANDPNPDNYLHCFGTLPDEHMALPLLDCARKNAAGTCPLQTGELKCLPPPTGSGFHYGISRAEEEDFTLEVQDFNQKPVEGLTVVACAPQSGCGKDCVPVASSIPSTKTDAKGKARLRVPIVAYHYTGCLQVTPPPTVDLLPMSVFTGRLIDQSEAQLTTYMFSLGFIAGAAATAPGAPEADFTTHGHVVGTVHDCLWWRVSGATVEITGGDATTAVAYIDGAAIGANPYTYPSGTFAIFNVPPGSHVITAKRDGQVLSSETVEVIAGHTSDANLFPTALP